MRCGKDWLLARWLCKERCSGKSGSEILQTDREATFRRTVRLEEKNHDCALAGLMSFAMIARAPTLDPPGILAT